MWIIHVVCERIVWVWIVGFHADGGNGGGVMSGVCYLANCDHVTGDNRDRLDGAELGNMSDIVIKVY